MIRVLHILQTLTPNGGMERFVMEYYRHIDKSKIQFDFVTHTDKLCFFEKEINGYGGKVYKFPPLTLLNIPRLYNIIDNFLKKHDKYDIIHCHLANAAFIYFPLAKKNGINVRIMHSHNSKYADKLTHAIRNYPLVKLGLLFTTDRFACTKLAGDFLFKSTPYFIIRNAIDTNKFSYNPSIRLELRDRFSFQDKIVIGNIGRFVPQKNHQFMVRVLRELIEYDERYVMCFLGDGELLEDVKRQTNDIKGHVFFLGVHENVEDYYQMFDIFILPSIYEGLGIVNIEAQCSGLPVIVSSNVPSDVGITNKIHFLELNEEKWVKMIKNTSLRNRHTNAEIISNDGYDIEVESKKLLHTYKKLLERFYR